jgi:hypothetical protein
MMRATMLTFVGVASLGALGACNNAKSPDAAAHDIAAADQSASHEVAQAQRDQQKDMSADAYNVAVAQADGDHNVAIQQCLALTGEAQKSCKERADAGYDQAKTHANVIRLSRLQ